MLAQIKGKFVTISFSLQYWIDKMNPLKIWSIHVEITYRYAYSRSSLGLSILKLKVHCFRIELLELPTF